MTPSDCLQQALFRRRVLSPTANSAVATTTARRAAAIARRWALPWWFTFCPPLAKATLRFSDR